MATRKKPVRGQRAKTNAAKKKSAKKSGSGHTVHRVTHGKGPRVVKHGKVQRVRPKAGCNS